MHMRYSLVAALVLTLATGGMMARGQATMPAGGSSLSPEFADAFAKLAAADFQEREGAITRLQGLLAKQVRQTIALQQVMLRVQQDLSAQLRALTGRASSDVEADARVAGLLEFNGAISRWASDCMALPAKERDAMLAWGASDAMLPLIAQLYSRSTDTRIQAIRDLAALQAPPAQANWLLLQMINDPNRAVALTAMDVLYTRTPDTAIVDAVWSRATAYLQQQLRGGSQPGRQRTITVADRTITYYDQEGSPVSRGLPDTDIAADLLVKFKDPRVGEKLDDLFREMGKNLQPGGDSRWRVITYNYGGGESARVVSKLLDAYQPKEAVRFLAKVLDQPMQDGNDTQINLNGQPEKVRMSSRIEAALMFIRATGQSADDFGLLRMPNYSPERWALRGTAAEEAAMIKKLQDWWKEHAKDYGTPELP
jgi:hypothetical protein